VTEVIKHRDCHHDALDSFTAKGGDARCHHGSATD
jgi:hypothetical protein